MEADDSCMPNIVEDNYDSQVLSASLEYLLSVTLINFRYNLNYKEKNYSHA